MSEMVERVAKAIYESYGLKRPWDKARLVGWEASTLIAARAAIKAMMQPTPASPSNFAMSFRLNDARLKK
jgi:hypothetical protein